MSARTVLSSALLATGAAGVVALPVLAPAPLQAAAEAAPPSTDGVTFDRTAHLSGYHFAMHDAVGVQMRAATQAYEAEQAAVRAAAEQAAARAAAEQAAADRAAAERAAADRASRSGRSAVAPAASGDPRSVAKALLAARGQSDQFGCLDKLWNKESGWSTTADNPTSSAYGIPQALPGSKMASAGADWRTSARTQIAWGLTYIADRYGSPCSAWSHSQSNNWY